jgi:hypothetical protein
MACTASLVVNVNSVGGGHKTIGSYWLNQGILKGEVSLYC